MAEPPVTTPVVTPAVAAVVAGEGVVPAITATPETNPAILALGQLLDSKLNPVLERLTTLESGQKSLEGKLTQTREEALASELEAKILQGGPGYKASEANNNNQVPLGTPNGPDMNWLAKELDSLMKVG